MSIFSKFLNIIIPRDSFLGDSYLSKGKQNGGQKVENFISCSKDEAIFELIKRAKVNGEWDICVDFGQLIINNLKNYNIKNIDLVTFVPPDKIRERVRGYHIPNIIAGVVSKKLNIPKIQLVQKFKHTKSQSGLNREKRVENVKNAFIGVKANIKKPKIILLIDDVCTTGSTINEVEKIIRFQFPKTKIIKICIYKR